MILAVSHVSSSTNGSPVAALTRPPKTNACTVKAEAAGIAKLAGGQLAAVAAGQHVSLLAYTGQLSWSKLS